MSQKTWDLLGWAEPDELLHYILCHSWKKSAFSHSQGKLREWTQFELMKMLDGPLNRMDSQHKHMQNARVKLLCSFRMDLKTKQPAKRGRVLDETKDLWELFQKENLKGPQVLVDFSFYQ